MRCAHPPARHSLPLLPQNKLYFLSVASRDRLHQLLHALMGNCETRATPGSTSLHSSLVLSYNNSNSKLCSFAKIEIYNISKVNLESLLFCIKNILMYCFLSLLKKLKVDGPPQITRW